MPTATSPNAPAGLRNEWCQVGSLADVPDGHFVVRRVDIARHKPGQRIGLAVEAVMLVRLAGEVFAVGSTCGHCATPLAASGTALRGRVLGCSCGGWAVDLDAELAGNDAAVPDRFPVLLVDDEVYAWFGPVAEFG